MAKHDLPYHLIGSESQHHIGGTRWCMDMEIVNQIMYQHIADTPPPTLLNYLPENLITNMVFREWLRTRFVTYDEYLSLFDQPITENIYLLTGTNAQKRKLFKTRNAPNEQGYFDFMKKVNPQLWEFFFTWVNVEIPAKDRRMHTYCIGASGCGKTELMKNQIIQDVKRGTSTVVFIDPKGDAALQLARHSINLINPDRLIYIDPFLDRNMTPVINPFDMPNKSEYFEDRKYKLIIEKRASQIMQALIQIFADADAKFTEKMQTYLYPAICVVMLKEDGDMTDLLRLFDGSDVSDLLALGSKSPNDEHRQMFQRGFTVPTQTKDAVRDKLQNMLNSGNLKDLVTGRSTIDLDSAINSKKFVIVNLSKGKLDPKPSLFFGKFVISLIQSIIFQRALEDEDKRVSTYLYVDEFHNYINDDIKELLNEGRAFAIHLYLASQTLYQEMNGTIRDAVAGNTKVKIVGMLNDTSKAPELSNILGVDRKVLEALPEHKFYVKIGKKKAFILHPSTKNLKNAGAMSFDDWQKVKQQQLDKYYRPLKERQPDSDVFTPKFKDE
ncbi:MAG: type IV secretion system DNA-binding domain-containing protein [Saprospiraceae bacterium]|nr:type IV secretion system DNA-binding domain-containing protein [Saprospiraceae bacterium]